MTDEVVAAGVTAKQGRNMLRPCLEKSPASEGGRYKSMDKSARLERG
jgi:hypothetical protein